MQQIIIVIIIIIVNKFLVDSIDDKIKCSHLFESIKSLFIGIQ